MGFKILAINPGSTSTKVALYDEERPSLDLTLRHTAEQIARYTNIIDQLGWRREMILTALSEHGFDIMQLSAVIGRGGLVRPIPAGVYEVNEAMRRDLTNATMEHASNLGGLLAAEIAAMAGVKAYIADPVVVDEMEDVARLSGHPDCPRSRSSTHSTRKPRHACTATASASSTKRRTWWSRTWAGASPSPRTNRDVSSTSTTRSTATVPSPPSGRAACLRANSPTSASRGVTRAAKSRKCWPAKAGSLRTWAPIP